MLIVNAEDQYLGTIQYANSSMKSFFGFTSDRILNRSYNIDLLMPKLIIDKHI
jgi:hypothetical protein